MNNFNFSLNDSQVSASSSNYFKPYTINEINSVKAEYATGTSSAGKEWKALDITFTGKEGSHRERYFIPATDAEGMTRGSYDSSNGGKIETPAPYEILKQLVIHILGVCAPAQFEKFKKYCEKVTTMQQFLDGFVKIINTVPEFTTNLKVVGRNSNGTVYARLPRPCGISKDKEGHYTNETFPINFLGDNLTFTSYEMGEKSKLAQAKPTAMEDTTLETEKVDDSSIDFDSLL